MVKKKNSSNSLVFGLWPQTKTAILSYQFFSSSLYYTTPAARHNQTHFQCPLAPTFKVEFAITLKQAST